MHIHWLDGWNVALRCLHVTVSCDMWLHVKSIDIFKEINKCCHGRFWQRTDKVPTVPNRSQS